jgi:hypothetical protein
MDEEKFEQRVIELIRRSLPIQNLNGNIEPIKLLRHRDRFYQVAAKVKGKERNLIFLRHERWVFLLDGLDRIPREPKKREYTYRTRSKAKAKKKSSKQKQKRILRERIELADKAHKELKQTSRVYVQRERG